MRWRASTCGERAGAQQRGIEQIWLVLRADVVDPFDIDAVLVDLDDDPVGAVVGVGRAQGGHRGRVGGAHQLADMEVVGVHGRRVSGRDGGDGVWLWLTAPVMRSHAICSSRRSSPLAAARVLSTLGLLRGRDRS